MSPYGFTTRPQMVWLIEAEWRMVYMRRRLRTLLVLILAFRLFGAKPLSEPTLEYCQLDSEILIEI